MLGCMELTRYPVSHSVGSEYKFNGARVPLGTGRKLQFFLHSIEHFLSTHSVRNRRPSWSYPEITIRIFSSQFLGAMLRAASLGGEFILALGWVHRFLKGLSSYGIPCVGRALLGQHNDCLHPIHNVSKDRHINVQIQHHRRDLQCH